MTSSRWRPGEPAADRLPTTLGAPVHVDFRKWGDREHWQYDATFLGTDQHGVWVGVAAGTAFARPGAAFEAERAQVVLFPYDAGYAPTFWDRLPGEPDRVLLYVDISTVPQWRDTPTGFTVSAVDLDLDVVQRVNGQIYVDDQDEFAEHQVSLRYPPEVIEQAERDCASVLEAVAGKAAPFDGTGFGWLQRFVQAAS